jgi:hypothetical protein
MRHKFRSFFRFLMPEISAFVVAALLVAAAVIFLPKFPNTATRFTALAQGTPNCSFTQSFTTATTGAVVQNGPTVSGGPQGCVAFRMVYWIQAGSGTVSALSIQIQGASTSGGSYTPLTPAVGGGSGSGSTTNPVTSSPNGQNVTCCDYWPFLQLQVNTFTVASGSPVLIVKVLGYAGTSAGAGTGGGGGGTIADTTNTLRGDGAGDAVAVAGTATNCVLVNGTSTSCASGQVAPNPAASAPTVAVPFTGWTLQNTSNAHNTFNDFLPNELVMSLPNFGSLQWGAVTRSLTVPYTLIAALETRGQMSGATASFNSGFCISDGTKYETLLLQLAQGGSNVELFVVTLTTLAASATAVEGGTSNIVGPTLTVKITNDGTHRTFYYWSSGAWTQYYQEATGTFLTETAAGMIGLDDVGSGGYAVDLALKYWSVQ